MTFLCPQCSAKSQKLSSYCETCGSPLPHNNELLESLTYWDQEPKYPWWLNGLIPGCIVVMALIGQFLYHG